MTNEALPETDEIKAKATETAQSRRLEIERITEIVLAVLDAHAKPPIPSVPWYGRWGKFLIDNWTFALSLLALGSLLGASLMYNASPLYYMKQLAASDRELNAKQAKFIFQQDQASRYVSLGKEFLDRGHFDDAFKAFDEALKFDENDVAAGLGKFKAELFKASANGEYDPEVIATRIRFGLQDKDGDLTDEHALTALGDLAFSSGDYETAKHNYDLSIKKRETPEALLGRGNVALYSENAKSAIGFFRRAHQLAPNDISYWVNLASSLSVDGYTNPSSLDQALVEYQGIVNADQEKLLPYIEVALVQLLKADFSASSKTMSYAAPLVETAKVLDLAKNQMPWNLRIDKVDFLFSSPADKRDLFCQLRALTSWLVDDTATTDTELKKLQSKPDRSSVQAESFVKAEVTLLRSRYPNQSSKLEAYMHRLSEGRPLAQVQPGN
jgi:tetratricopeptide (TPR) repeat protein